MSRRSIWRPNLTDVATVVGKELRETLRDRRTLAVMILFPLVVYPLISLAMAQVMASKQAADEARPSRVAVVAAESGVPASELDGLRSRLGPPGVTSRFTVRPPSTAVDAPSAEADLAADRLDAVVELGGPVAAGAVARKVRLLYDATRSSSETARDRLESVLTMALPAGCSPSYAVAPTSIAPRIAVGGYVLSKIIPLIVVLMTMLGAFYPAIDITAGERERGTLETLLSSPVHRFDLMTGKVLAVAVLAALTGILNIASMSITVAEGAKLAGAGQALSIPWTRAALTVLMVLPAAFLFAAVMVAIGALARGFKEAQTLLTPVYLLCFTPSLIASVAEFRLEGLVALVPGTNLTLLARDLMLGQAHLHLGGVVATLVSTVLFGALALSFAARLYDSERLLSASDGEVISLGAWLAHLFGRGGGRPPRAEAVSPARAAAAAQEGPTPAHSAALFGVAFILWFFAFTWLQRWQLIPGLLVSQWVGFLGLVWVYARGSGQPMRRVLALRVPRASALLGATLLGLSGWVLLGLLADRLMPPPKHLVEEMRKLIRPPDGSRPLAVSLAALALTPAICEEALFRGPILRGFRSRFSVAASCILTGVLFGMLHGDVWRFVPTTLLGILLSWVALTSGSIVPSMLVHVINNGALIVLAYHGLDEAAEKLPPRVELALFAGATLLFLGGIVAVRRGRATVGGGPERGQHSRG